MKECFCKRILAISLAVIMFVFAFCLGACSSSKADAANDSEFYLSSATYLTDYLKVSTLTDSYNNTQYILVERVNGGVAWVERALTLDHVREMLLNEALGLEPTDIFGLRMQPHKNNKRQTKGSDYE